MLDRADKIRLLIRKYLAGDLSVEEKVEFDSWLSASEENQKLLDSFTDDTLFDNLLKEYFESARLAEALPVPDVYQNNPGMIVEIKKKNTWSVRKWVAASILVLIGVSILYYQIDGGKKEALPEPANHVVINQPEIMPANGSAILMLDNGRRVELDSLDNGTIDTAGGKKIILQDGQLSYKGISTRVARNTLFTTKGNVIGLTLADGSKVSLNAESSIQYPTEFDGSDRVVEITGEVIFKVAKDVHKPFRVFVITSSGRKNEVEVLGTHFNVNAHGDETSMVTTLLEGKIKISGYSNNDSTVLKPRQQARIDKSGKLKVLDSVDTDVVVAWKERNIFYFKDEDVKTIMRQLSRWYDISVKYKEDLPKRTFSGLVNRKLTLRDVLDILEQGMSGIKFEIKGKIVEVIP